jgi:hypothetical protein
VTPAAIPIAGIAAGCDSIGMVAGFRPQRRASTLPRRSVAPKSAMRLDHLGALAILCYGVDGVPVDRGVPGVPGVPGVAAPGVAAVDGAPTVPRGTVVAGSDDVPAEGWAAGDAVGVADPPQAATRALAANTEAIATRRQPASAGFAVVCWVRGFIGTLHHDTGIIAAVAGGTIPPTAWDLGKPRARSTHGTCAAQARSSR